MKRRTGMGVPLLKLAVSLILGIVAAHYWSPDVPWKAVFSISVVVMLLLTRQALLQSLAICLCFVELGFIVSERRTPPPLPEGAMQAAVVMSELTEKPKTMMVDLYLPRLSETRRCYVWKDSLSRQLHLGQALLVDLRDERFVRWDGWQTCGDGMHLLSRLQRLQLRAMQQRHRLLERYQSLQAGNDQYAILAAMTLGDKSALTSELRETYAVTGASHVLALSGLHLGIIWWLLMNLKTSRRRSLLRQVFLVVCIWGFAFITGLSASIVRAATMLTVYSVFSLGGRGRSPLNVLCFTAIVMLLYRSESLFDVGFQLSFSSMFSILLFTPLFEQLFRPGQQSWLGSRLWSLSSVSLAAQLGVAPLITYYFGRFATYFLLTNFIVIPAATIIIYGALLTLLVPQVGTVLVWVVKGLNTTLDVLSRLPWASIEGLHPTVTQVVLCYVIVACFYFILRKLFAH